MTKNSWPKIQDWECRDGEPDEDHDWRMVCGDPTTGEGDSMECAQCGKIRAATEGEIADSYADAEFDA